MPSCIAEVASRHDVRRDVLAAVASGLDMLGSALKPLCQPRRNPVAPDEFLGPGIPHRVPAIETATTLLLGRLLSEILESVS